MPLLSDLPIELVLEILRLAACSAIHERREWAVNVASVGRDAYRLVKNVLYATMVVSTANIQRVHETSLDASCLHVFRAVRRLVITPDTITFYSGEQSDSQPVRGRRIIWEATHFARLFSSVTDLDVPINALRVLSSSPSFCPSRLAIRYSTFSTLEKDHNHGEVPETDADAGPDAFRALTHLCGFLPLLPESVNALLAAAPALTHLAFDFTRVLPPGPHRVSSLPPPDASRVEKAIRAVLKHPRMQVVGLVGDSTSLINITSRFNDHRIKVWSRSHATDDRTSADEERDAAEISWSGRDAWTEVRDVY